MDSFVDYRVERYGREVMDCNVWSVVRRVRGQTGKYCVSGGAELDGRHHGLAGTEGHR